jgi:hypothetical protein
MITLTVNPASVGIAKNNPNRMDSEKYGLLVKAIEKFGFLSPILIRQTNETLPYEYQVIDGHHRLRAAQDLKLDQIPAVLVKSDNEEMNALQVGMNRLRGELDLSMTSQILLELKSANWSMDDLSHLGFTIDELDIMLSTEVDLEEFPESIEAPADGMTSDKPFLLELEFESHEDFKEVKRKLKRAAGKTGTLADGLLRLLRGEE